MKTVQVTKNLVVAGRCGSGTSSLCFGLSTRLELGLYWLPRWWWKVSVCHSFVK